MSNHDLTPAIKSFQIGVALVQRVKELEAELKQVKVERDELLKQIAKEQGK